MKKHISIFLSFFILGSACLFAQVQDNGNHGFMTLTLKNKDLSEIKGTPYLEENYTQGTVFLEGKDPLKVFMRYDVQNEIIEIKTDLNSNEIYLLPPGKKAKYEIDNQTFVYDKIKVDGKQILGYFIEHFNGENFRFLEKHLATVTEAVAASTGYGKDTPAEIKIESQFYIQKEDGKMEYVRLKHKDIKKSFTSKTANTYLSKNKIKNENDLVDLLKHLDQQ